MRIMLFSRILAKTGVGNYINQLSAELARKGHDVTVVSGTKDIELADGVAFVKVPALSSTPTGLMACVRQLRKIIKEKDIDVVHCHHRKASLIMRLYNVVFHIPVVYTLHSTNIPSDFLHKKLTFVGDRAIAISGEVKQFMEQKLKINTNKIRTVYNGVSVIKKDNISDYESDEIKKEWNISHDRCVIVLHSRIDKVKNHIHVVEALNGISYEAKKNIVVVCSGEKEGSYYEEVIAKIEEYKLQDNFRFVGWVSAEKILRIADFLFAPSTNEGFMLSAIEAFMMKVPVARTRTAGFDEQKYCFPISAYDTKETIKILEDLACGNKKKYQENIDNAYDLAMTEFTVEAMTKKNILVYKEVVKKNEH